MHSCALTDNESPAPGQKVCRYSDEDRVGTGHPTAPLGAGQLARMFPWTTPGPPVIVGVRSPGLRVGERASYGAGRDLRRSSSGVVSLAP